MWRGAVARCSIPQVAALVSLASFAISCQSSRSLDYRVDVSSRHPREVTVTLTLQGTSGAYLDLRGYVSRDVMRLTQFEARSTEGRRLKTTEIVDTTRAGGKLIETLRYRIAGPLPPTVTVRYHVSPGRREGDEHLGFSGRCFGYVSEHFALVTGRGLFLLPQAAPSYRQIHVQFTLPQGWSAVTPWRKAENRWVVDLPGAAAAEHLIAATLGMGVFRERSFRSGRTQVRLAFAAGIPEVEADRTSRGVEQVVRYVRRLMGRDLGPEYLAVVVPETLEGDEVVGESWATGQGGTLVPLSAERLRRLAQGVLEAYVRHAPYRTEIRRAEEFWLIDAITNWYSWRAVASAGLADEDEVNRALASGYLIAVTTEGLQRNLERYDAGGQGDLIPREVLAPFVLFHLDHELRSRYGLKTGFDSLVPRLFAGRSAPSVWALLPGSSPHAWDSFRARYVCGSAYAPVPDLFALAPTRPSPSPPGGVPVQYLTLLYTGNTYGYLENCGCKVNQSGGVARRATVVQELRRADPEAILLDAGNAFVRREPFEVPNFLTSREQRLYLEMDDLMRYDAGAIGVTELANGPEYFREETRRLNAPLLAANVSFEGHPLGLSSVALRSRHRRIAVIGLLEPPRGGTSVRGFGEQLARLTISDPVEVARREAAALRRHADLVIAMGRLTPSTIRRIAAGCPNVDVVISTDYRTPRWAEGASARHREIQDDDRSGFLGRTLVLYAHMGQYGLSRARLGVDRDGRIVRADLTDHWLGEDVPDHAGVRDRLNRFYDRVGRTQQAQASARPPLAGDPYWQHRHYAGAAACAACHEAEFAQWKTTGHASAYKTLLDRHRHYQPVCISCHVVGFGSEYGYRIGQPEEPLGNVQCEVCHGPGGEHVLAPARTNIRRTVPERVCLECHNPEHSDHFVYAERLPKVRHNLLTSVSAR